MIRIFGDYYDKHGNRYKVVSFNGSKYACESAKTGKVTFFSPNELLPRMPLKKVQVQQPVIIKKEEEPVVEVVKEEKKPVVNDVPVSYEPIYEEPVYEEPVHKKENVVTPSKEILKDNTEETADSDFYADF